VAGFNARSRLRCFTAETIGWPCVHDLSRPVCERELHIVDAGHDRSIQLGNKFSRRMLARPARKWPTFRLPFRQTAVEDEDLPGPEDTERPPHSRCAAKSGAVIDHDGVILPDAELADLFRKLRRPRQHVRQLGRMIGDCVDIEKHRTRNVSGEVFRLGIALERRQIE